MRYRLAEAADAEAIGAMHVRAWQESYAGLLPAATLAGLDPARRAAEWRAGLTRGRAVGLALQDGALAGFAAWGDTRDAAFGTGEIYAIYVLRAVQRLGLGRGLMAMAAEGLTALGHASAGLWVFERNDAARAFYERLGGRAGLPQVFAIDGTTLTEVAYVWETLDSLRVR